MSRFALSLVLALAACQTLEPTASPSLKLDPQMVDPSDSVAIAEQGTGYSFGIGRIADVMDALAYVTPCATCLDSIEQRAQGLSDGTCPRVTVLDDRYLEIQGDCTTRDGSEILGRMVVHTEGDVRVTSFESFVLREPAAGFAFEASGSYRTGVTADGTDLSYNLSYVWRDGGSTDGRFAYDLDVRSVDGLTTLSGEVGVNAGRAQGTFAVTSTMQAVDGCADEGAGTIELLGTDDAVLRTDGDKTCDACGTIALGGEDLGEVCR